MAKITEGSSPRGLLTMAVPRHRLLTLAVACVGVLAATINGSAGAGKVRSTPGPRETVRVDIQGPGRGSVLSIPRGIDCRPSCVARFPRGEKVVLVAGSNRASRFVSWEGDCVGTSVSCVLIPEGAEHVTARFAPAQDDIGSTIQTRYWLYVSVSGGGKITSSPEGINCPTVCKSLLKRGIRVTLHALSPPGYSSELGSLFGSCRTDACELVMDANAYVTAAFRKARQ